MIFGPLSESAGVQNGTQNRPSGAKRNQKSIYETQLCTTRSRIHSRIAFGALLGTILVDLGWNFDEMLMKSDINFRDFLLHFSRNFSQFLSKQTSRTSRNLQKHDPSANGALAAQPPPTTCTLQTARSCNKRQITKIGGGGSRAAWRIQIGLQPGKVR